MSESNPTFSICHATARSLGWQDSWRSWFNDCDDRSCLEYVLSVDDRFGFDSTVDLAPLTKVVHLPTYMRMCSVDNWNNAVASSHGDVIVLNADDFFPPQHWDSLLRRAIKEAGKTAKDIFAVHTSTGNPDLDWDRRLMALGIISRSLYERWGYALYPEYESMDSDVDMTEHAYQDRLVIEAFDLTFEHRHPAFGKAPNDAVYSWQNRPEAYRMGREILERRRSSRFSR